MAGLLLVDRWYWWTVGRLMDGRLMEGDFSRALSGKSKTPMAASAMRSIVEYRDVSVEVF